MKQLHNFCVYSIKTISLVISCLLLVLVLTTRAFQPQGSDSVVQIMGQPMWYYILLPFSTLCIILAKKAVDRIPARVLFAVFAVLYILAGVYLILNVPENIRSDQRDVFNAALEFNQSNYEQLAVGAELFRNPHNMGIVTFYRIITVVNQSTKFAFAVNLVLIILTNFFIYKTADVCFEDKTAAGYTVLLSFAFLPQFFYTLFVYGNVPGFCFVTAMVYCAAMMSGKIPENRTAAIIYGILSVICGTTAVLLRSNYIIAVIAVVIICMVEFMDSRKAANIVLAAVLAVSAVVAQNMVTGHYEKKVGYEIEGIPMNLYIAMGLQESEKGPGWYNDFNHKTFTENGFDTQKSKEAGSAAIKDRLEYFADNPQYAFGFFRDKLITTWCEPTCQSIYSGPVESKGQIVENPLLKNLYSGGKIYEIVYLFCSLVVTNLLLFSVVCQLCVFKDKEFSVWMLFTLLFFIGGFLFHIIWETKSRYICVYYAALVPIAANGVKLLADKIKKHTIIKNTTDII